MLKASTSVQNTLKSQFKRVTVLSTASLFSSAVLLMGLYLAFFDRLYPEFRSSTKTTNAQEIILRGNTFQPVVFEDGGLDGTSAVVTRLAQAFPTDHVILRQSVSFEAKRFPFLELSVEGLQPGIRANIFWKSSETGTETHYLPLDMTQRRVSLHNLLRSQKWRGEIKEIAIGFFGELRKESIRFEHVTLKPFQQKDALQLVWQEWTNFSPWVQNSIFSQRGVPEGALLRPNLAVTCWLTLATLVMIILWVLTEGSARTDKARGTLVFGVLGCWLIPWLFVDSLWQYRLIKQNVETLYLFAGKTEEQKMMADWDGDLYAFAKMILGQHLPDEQQKIAILWSSDTPKTWAGRLRYHLLPAHHGVLISGLETPHLRIAMRDFEWLIVIGTEHQNLAEVRRIPSLIEIEKKAGITLKVAYRNYALYRVNQASAD